MAFTVAELVAEGVEKVIEGKSFQIEKDSCEINFMLMEIPFQDTMRCGFPGPFNIKRIESYGK